MNERAADPIRDVLDAIASAASGNSAMLRAVRTIFGLSRFLRSVPRDIINPILAVESETDHLPDESWAYRYDPRAFEEKIRERDAYFDRYREEVLRLLSYLRQYLEPT